MTSFLLFLASILALPAVTFGAYRCLLPVLGKWRSGIHTDDAGKDVEGFSVGLVTVSHTHTSVLADKLTQFQLLADELKGTTTPVDAIYVGLDGVEAPDPCSQSEFKSAHDAGTVQWISSPVRKGKNHVLRNIVREATTEVLLFSDVDANVDSASCRALLKHLHHNDVGAVTGCRQIVDTSDFADGQKSYVAGDDKIRAAEMEHLGSVTSSDGKLYAIKTALIDELPADVTDDLYTALGAVASGKRLVSEPAAQAIIGRPAKDIRHELSRRRRVTTRGLSTVWRRRALMNPFRTGGYGIGLFINKVLRRLAGPGLIMSAFCILLLVAQLLFWLHSGWLYLMVGLSVIPLALILKSSPLRYLSLGLLGMSLGVIDFLCGKRIERWEPRKQLADGGDLGNAS
ncbi:MAG: hypothetical protein KTR32_42365 [Granulosicoccus sp.]|nr:hypothetical protein [Granulosicoccus sp.]